MKKSLSAGFEIEFKELSLDLLREELSKKPGFDNIDFTKSRKNINGDSWKICYEANTSVTIDNSHSAYNFYPQNQVGGEISSPIFDSKNKKEQRRLLTVIKLIQKMGGIFDLECGFHVHFEIPKTVDLFCIALALLYNEEEIYNNWIPRQRWNYSYITSPRGRLTAQYLKLPIKQKLKIILDKHGFNDERLFDHDSAYRFRYHKDKTILEVRMATVFKETEKNLLWFRHIEEIISDAVFNTDSMLRFLTT